MRLVKRLLALLLALPIHALSIPVALAMLVWGTAGRNARNTHDFINRNLD